MRLSVTLSLLALLLAGCDSSVSTPVAQPAPGNPDQGRPLFVKSCAECHGFNAHGTDKGPPLIHKIYQPNHHADIAFVLAAKQGVRAHHWPFGDMPPRPEISATQIRDIIAWVRQEQHKAGIR